MVVNGRPKLLRVTAGRHGSDADDGGDKTEWRGESSPARRWRTIQGFASAWETCLFFSTGISRTRQMSGESRFCRHIYGSEEHITATNYLTNSRVEGWRSVHGSDTRTLHQNTTLRGEVTSIAHATRVKYG